MNWWDAFLVIDTETTGLSFEDDRIIQFGWALFIKGQCMQNDYFYLQSDVENGEKAAEVNRITPEQIADGLPQIDSMRIMKRMLFAGMPVVAYNAPFDLNMIAHSFEREGLTANWDELRILDPLVIHRHYAKNIPVYMSPYRQLQNMARRFGVSDPTHDACADAKTTGELLLTFRYHYPIRRSALELHRDQVKWYDTWSANFIRYAQRKNFEIKVSDFPMNLRFLLKYEPETLMDML